MEISKHIPDVKLWRNHVGRFKDRHGKYHTVGLCPGSADLIGILKPFGVFIAVEVKTCIEHNKIKRGRLSDHVKRQQQFLDCIKLNGGIACFASEWKDVAKAINEWKTKNSASNYI